MGKIREKGGTSCILFWTDVREEGEKVEKVER